MLCEQDITACTIRHLNIDGANERDIDTIDTVERSEIKKRKRMNTSYILGRDGRGELDEEEEGGTEDFK